MLKGDIGKLAENVVFPNLRSIALRKKSIWI